MIASSFRRSAASLAVSLIAGFAMIGPPSVAVAMGDGRAVANVCATVVGLAPGEKHFAACEQSLADSLRNLRGGEALAGARRGCLSRGYRPGTAGLAECELAAAPARDPAGPSYASSVPGGSRSYFLVSRDTAFQRDQLACARLGFDPAQSAFADCASQLRGALARASDPAM